MFGAFISAPRSTSMVAMFKCPSPLASISAVAPFCKGGEERARGGQQQLRDFFHFKKNIGTTIRVFNTLPR
jgi:hypothetical protein